MRSCNVSQVYVVLQLSQASPLRKSPRIQFLDVRWESEVPMRQQRRRFAVISIEEVLKRIVPENPSKPVILCIDDDGPGLKVRQLLLEVSGFRVLTANDGPTGLQIVRQEHVDAVVLDYLMPVMDGGEVAKRLRSEPTHLPILILSGCREIPDSTLSLVDAFLEKGRPSSVLIQELQRLTNASSYVEAKPDRRLCG